MKTAVVGHVEWVTFARVDHVPQPGEIVHAEDVFELPAGGGAVAAVQLLKLAGNCMFYTAFGDDALGRRAKSELQGLGVDVESVFRDEAQRRAFTHVDGFGERTITVMGERLGPRASDPLPWDELADVDALFFTAGDDEALRMSRKAKVLVATTREAERIARVGEFLDAAVGSGRDPSESYAKTTPDPGLIVNTLGKDGGRYLVPDGRWSSFDGVQPSGPIVCAYGAGDSFAAGLTFGLGSGRTVEESLALAARCGANTLTGQGPYEGQLTSDDL
ncbi:MAG: PfkB family carbohydrate kinase [Actinomycetota bacterium]